MNKFPEYNDIDVHMHVDKSKHYCATLFFECQYSHFLDILWAIFDRSINKDIIKGIMMNKSIRIFPTLDFA